MVKAMPEKVLESMVAHSPIGRAWEHRKMLPTTGVLALMSARTSVYTPGTM